MQLKKKHFWGEVIRYTLDYCQIWIIDHHIEQNIELTNIVTITNNVT